MSDIVGTIREMILQDKKASNVERLHIASMAEIAEHLGWMLLALSKLVDTKKNIGDDK